MSARRDMALMNAAMKQTGVKLKSDDYAKCLAIIVHFEQSSGLHAYNAITVNPLCGPRHSSLKQQRKTRPRRAGQIRRQMKPGLQEVGLLPAGSILWLLLTSPTVWRFVLNWIKEVLADREED